MYAAYAAVISTSLYIMGGWCPTSARNMCKVYKYELYKNQWSVLPHLKQYLGIPVNIDDQLTVIGGRHATTQKPSTLVTTFINDRWKNMYPNLSVARVHPAVVPYYQYVIVAGGKGTDEIVTDNIELFDTAERQCQWRIVNTHLPNLMYNISATVSGDFFTIVGYSDGADNKHHSGTFVLPIDEIISQQQTQQSPTSSTDKETTKWHTLGDAPYWGTAVLPNTLPLVVMGGRNEQGSTVNDIVIFDDTSKEWKKIASLPINCAGLL